MSMVVMNDRNIRGRITIHFDSYIMLLFQKYYSQYVNVENVVYDDVKFKRNNIQNCLEIEIL